MKKMIYSLALCIIMVHCSGDGDEGGIKNPYAPVVLPTAEINIASNFNPIVFTWNPLTLQYETAYTITVSETNNVGCTISTVESAYYFSGQTYTPVTLQGGRLNANGSLSFNFTGWMVLALNYQIRIEVRGSDDNGHTLVKEAFFNITFI